MSFLESLYLGSVLCSLVMVCAWFVSRTLNYYSLVDVVWSLGIGPLVGFYAWMGTGSSTKRIWASGFALFWSLRLGTHLFLRLKSFYPQEDTRYAELKQQWGAFKFLLFFLFQGLSQVIFALPLLSLTQDSEPTVEWPLIAGTILYIVGLAGETVADQQLKRFRSRVKSREDVCDQGLWKYSRHPNYFFEWLIWCGIGLSAIHAPNGMFGLLSPLLMFMTLNYFTGVPAAERQSLLSKGDRYRAYQARTNRFFLGFPK